MAIRKYPTCSLVVVRKDLTKNKPYGAIYKTSQGNIYTIIWWTVYNNLYAGQTVEVEHCRGNELYRIKNSDGIALYGDSGVFLIDEMIDHDATKCLKVGVIKTRQTKEK